MSSQKPKTSLRFLASLLSLWIGLFSSISDALPALRCQGALSAELLQTSPGPRNKYEELAEELGLTYLKSPLPKGYQRTLLSSRTYLKKDGTPGKTLNYYRYTRPDGSIIRPRLDAQEYVDVVGRFRSFKVDPKWKDIWMSADEDTHIQVTAQGNHQESITIYHQDWGPGASKAKFQRVEKFGHLVGDLRLRLNAQLEDTSLSVSSKEKVESLALLLLMSGRIRVGDAKYLVRNGTTGVTTLMKNQIFTDEDGRLFLRYIGKSGNKKPQAPTSTQIEITEPRLKQNLLLLKDSNPEDPRLLIFHGRNVSSGLLPLTPSYLNRRLRELSSTQQQSGSIFSVKDLRTWAATVKTVEELIRSGRPPESLNKKYLIIQSVAKKVSLLLNNTPGVARKDYIDPRILNPDAMVQLWALDQEQFLSPRKTETETQQSRFDVKYDESYEALALAFLDSIHK